MSRVFDRLADNGSRSAITDWLVFAAGVVALSLSIAASLTAPAPDRLTGIAARQGPQAEVTPG